MDGFGRHERGDAPPILTLLDLIEEHRPAFEYDWRTRFGCRFDVPAQMSWGEAWRLTMELASDPSSHVAAGIYGWDHAVSYEWMLAANAYDAFVSANSDPKKSRPAPYPRPWDEKPKAIGAGTSMSVAEYRALRARIEAPAGRSRDARGRFTTSP